MSLNSVPAITVQLLLIIRQTWIAAIMGKLRTQNHGEILPRIYAWRPIITAYFPFLSSVITLQSWPVLVVSVVHQQPSTSSNLSNRDGMQDTPSGGMRTMTRNCVSNLHFRYIQDILRYKSSKHILAICANSTISFLPALKTIPGSAPLIFTHTELKVISLRENVGSSECFLRQQHRR